MSDDTQVNTPQEKKKKWTLMFFFASDNLLSPSMLTQIKSINAAGYQRDTNVLLHFDPNERGAPTRIFEINRSEKDRPSRIGDCDGPLVSVLTHDDITPKDMNRTVVDAVKAPEALESFLTLCRQNYPADHYMLFLVGHGMVVGRDMFLPDENPKSSIGLAELGLILKRFSDAIKLKNEVLELIGMHSCSMSGVEVAYELKGRANYMMASQGISFIGAWPYRQMLVKIYNAIEAERGEGAQPLKVLTLAQEMHELCIQHSADFMVGGYSADLCLSSLNSDNVEKLDEPIKNLGVALTDGLNDARCRDLILLAHWKAQSYWQETYTDLYDFCLCLRRLCRNREEKRPDIKDSKTRQPRRYDLRQEAIEKACDTVIKTLQPSGPASDSGPVIRTDFIGAASQYSYGYSIYFPWTEPIQDKNEAALSSYDSYIFNKSAAATWLEFLKAYFKLTQRPDRLVEDVEYNDVDLTYQSILGYQEGLAAAREAFRIPGMPPMTQQSVPGSLDQKVNPPDAGGSSCTCPAIKNYSKDFLMSPGASGVFVEKKEDQSSDEKAA